MSHHTVVTWEKGLVRAAVARLSEGSAELLGIASAPVQGVGPANRPDPDRWFAGCERALTQAEDMTQRWAGRKVVPDHVTMTIPTTVTRGLTVTDEVQRPNPRKPITQDELVALLRRGYRKAQDRLDVRARGSKEDIVCGALAFLSLDGRPVTSPEGLVGEHLRISQFLCLAPTEWIRSLEVIAERLGLEIVTIVPHHMAYAAAIADTVALLVVVDDRMTVMDLVRQGRVEWAAAVPQGSEELIHEAVAQLSIPERQIEALLRAYRAGELREDIESLMSKCYWAALRRWMSALADQVRRNGHESFMPYQIYAYDVAGIAPEIAPALETPYWEQRLPFGRCPKVDRLDANGGRNVLDCTAQAGGEAHLLLRSLACYVARLYAPGNELDRALVDTIHWRHSS
jgi:hypothetical protein